VLALVREPGRLLELARVARIAALITPRRGWDEAAAVLLASLAPAP
jgi:hypothetical protein